MTISKYNLNYSKLSLCLTKHHAMKTYWGNGGIAPRILDLGIRWGEWLAARPGRFTPRERASGPIRQEAGWAPSQLQCCY